MNRRAAVQLAAGATATAALLALAGPAAAAASLWGYSGLALMPTGEVLQTGQYRVSGEPTILDSDFLWPISLSAGIARGLELTLDYPGRAGGGPALTGSAIYQLVGSTPENPTRVAIGLTNLALGPVTVPGSTNPSFVSPNNLFMVVSRDIDVPISGQLRNIASLHLGFTGAALSWPFVNLASRVMAGLELPVSDALDIYGEYFGPSSQSGQFFDVGLRLAAMPGLDLDVASIGEPGLSPTERAYSLGVAYSGQWPLFGRPARSVASAPAAIADSLSDRPRPARPEAVAGLAPPPAPVATLYGRITDSAGAPLAGADVGVVELDRWSQATGIGDYFVDSIPKGAYTLAVRDGALGIVATRSIQIGATGPIEEDVRVPSAGALAGDGRPAAAGPVPEGARAGTPGSLARIGRLPGSLVEDSHPVAQGSAIQVKGS